MTGVKHGSTHPAARWRCGTFQPMKNSSLPVIARSSSRCPSRKVATCPGSRTGGGAKPSSATVDAAGIATVHWRGLTAWLLYMIEFKLNGETVRLDVEDDTPLLWALREKLELTGTKFGCGVGCVVRAPSMSTERPVRACRPRAAGRRASDDDDRGPRAKAGCTRCSRRGSKRTYRSAATARAARSWRRSCCSRQSRSRPMRKSTTR